MALTIDQKKRVSLGSATLVIADVDFDSSYPTGGEAFTLADFGLSQSIYFGIAQPSNGHTFQIDRANKKIKVLRRYSIFTATVNPASATTDTIQNVVVTVNGVSATDIVRAIPPTDLESGVVPIAAWASNTNEVTVRLANPTGGTVDGAAKTWTFHTFGANDREVTSGTDLSSITNVRVALVGV